MARRGPQRVARMTSQLLWVGIGGSLGAVARVLVGTMVAGRFGVFLPFGTFVVNVSGCFLLGLVVGAIEAQAIHPGVRPALAIGFLGAYTTFSTFGLETVTLLEEGNVLFAVAYVSASVLVGLATVALGLWTGRSFA